jgi:hypothetical protein
MESLLADLGRDGAGGYCPHGRPSVWLITMAELDRRFGRT